MTAATSGEVDRLRDMISAGWRTVLIHHGVMTGLFDALSDEPQEAAAIAGKLGLHADTVLRVLRALTSIELVRQTSRTAFAITPMGALLQSANPANQRGHAVHWGGRTLDSIRTIDHTLRTGEPGRGNGNFAELNADSVNGQAFNRAMADQSRPVARALAKAHDFSTYARVMDVGGGYGGSLTEVLLANPGLSGAIYDLPALEGGARAYLTAAGVADRVRYIGGSFFESVAPEADCILLKYILHDWSDPECETIMANCRAALQPGNRLLLIERIMPEQVTPAHEDVVRADMVMMPINGRERTLAEFTEMASAAGFRMGEVKPLADGCSVMVLEAA